MNILVTGNAGFIGQVLVQQLKSAGHTVIGLDIDFDHLPHYFIQHDLLRPLNRQVAFDLCIHLASAVGGFLFNTKRDLIEINRKINESVMALCKAACCNRLIFFSSINVFETTQSFVHDRLPTLDQKTPYAYSKACGELLFSEAFEHSMMIRPTNVFGKSQRCTHRAFGESHVIPDLLKKIEEGDTVSVLGDGTQVRNFVHVRDICAFVTRNLEFSGKHYFNLRSDITMKISDLTKELIDFSGRDVKVVFDPTYMKYELFTIPLFDLAVPFQYGWKPEIQSIRAGLLL